MPKNKGAGGKKRRKGKGSAATPQELILKADGQEYGQVIKSLGNGFMEIMCFSDNGSIKRRAHIRGKMRKRVWMSEGDLVLVAIRDFQDSTCDIVLKYSSNEAHTLRSKGLVPHDTEINENEDQIVIMPSENGQGSESESDERIRGMPPSESETESDSSSTDLNKLL